MTTASSQPRLIVAPLQGFTNRHWRAIHRAMYPGAEYIAPFIHIEHHQPRNRDLRDIAGDDNSCVIPQIIARDADEMSMVLESVIAQGYNRANINMGCPHPPQTSRGRGSGLLLHPERLDEIIRVIIDHPEIKFSVKMRHGVDSPDQWITPLEMLNQAPLEWVALHPRTARQLYRGDIDFQQWEKLLSMSNHPTIFNGDITTPLQAKTLLDSNPKIAGIMAGRGVLSRPSLLHEIATGLNTEVEKQIEDIIELHNGLLEKYQEILCGDAQILSAIQPYWTYIAPLLPPRTVKPLLKARNLNSYRGAISSVVESMRQAACDGLFGVAESNDSL